MSKGGCKGDKIFGKETPEKTWIISENAVYQLSPFPNPPSSFWGLY